MRRKLQLACGLGLIGAALAVSLYVAQSARAQADIQFPVAELGNCADKTACKAYCDKPAHQAVCLSFAEKHGLMSKQEVDMARKFSAGSFQGPGGCKDKEACESYCNDVSHLEECVSFAEKNNIMPADELAEARKVRDALKRGVKMPGCNSKKSCDSYCSAPDHMEECMTFAMEAGLMRDEEKADAQKMLKAIKAGAKPPNCRGKEECDVYCSSGEHIEECMNFAMAAGFMSEEEKANAQGMLKAVKAGVKPPPCRGKEECDAYCGSEAHFEECARFAVAAGMMSEKDFEMSKKTKGRGPGGCRSREECEAFCTKPENQETCFNFSKENGLISADQLKEMEEGNRKFKESLDNAPPEVKACLTEVLGDLSQVKPGPGTGDKMRQCFEKFGGPGAGRGEQGGPQMVPGTGSGEPRTGPGGCKNREECEAYCRTHPNECGQGPGPAEGGQIQPSMPPQGGPGGCRTREECETYCRAHPNECGAAPGAQMQPQPPAGMMPPQGVQPPLNGTPPPPGAVPPAGATPPDGTAPLPPAEMQPQLAPAEMQLPPSGTETPPPADAAPTSLRQVNKFLGTIIQPLLDLLKK